MVQSVGIYTDYGLVPVQHNLHIFNAAMELGVDTIFVSLLSHRSPLVDFDEIYRFADSEES